MALVASALVCIGFLWVLHNARRRVGPRLRPITLACMFVAALSATNVLRYADELHPASWLSLLTAVAAAGTLVLSLALWKFIPAISRERTHNELLRANEAMAAEHDARLAVLKELSHARDELERRVEERTAALDLARRRFETALQGTGIVVAHQDCDLRYTWMYNAPPPLRGDEVVGRLPSDLLPADLAERQARVKNEVIATGKPMKFDAVYKTPTGPIWYEGRVEPLFVDGKLEGVMTVSIDVTKHILHERHMRDVMRELTHRSRNLLAVVQGVARQSAVGTTDVRQFIDGFDSRLEALSRAHELLIDTNWRGVSLRAIVDRELASLAPRLLDPRIEGPDLLLSPEAAQNFALAINELAGGLRQAAAGAPADLTVSWRVEDGALRFEWRRQGGGDAQPDGFGRNLLNRVLPRQIDGRAQLTHAQDACAYWLEGRSALLAPIGRAALERPDESGDAAARQDWRPRQDSNL